MGSRGKVSLGQWSIFNAEFNRCVDYADIGVCVKERGESDVVVATMCVGERERERSCCWCVSVCVRGAAAADDVCVCVCVLEGIIGWCCCCGVCMCVRQRCSQCCCYVCERERGLVAAVVCVCECV